MLNRNRQPGNGSSGDGFTLMEVMLAMAILAIVLVVAFQSQSQSLSMSGRSRFLTTASLLAQSRMAELEFTGLDNLMITTGNFGDAYPDYSWKIEVADTAFELMKKVTVRVINNSLYTNNQYIIEYYTVLRGNR